MSEVSSRPLDEIVELFLNGHCAAFAYGAWLELGSRAENGISILIDEDGEPNFDPDENEDMTRCVVHAYLSRPDDDLDAMGIRTPEEMADHYGLGAHSIDGPFSAEEFLTIFCGDGGPFELDAHSIALAQDQLHNLIPSLA